MATIVGGDGLGSILLHGELGDLSLGTFLERCSRS